MEVHLTGASLILAFDNINSDEQQHPKDRESKKKLKASLSEGRLAGLEVSIHPFTSLALPDKKEDSDLIFLILVFF